MAAHSVAADRGLPITWTQLVGRRRYTKLMAVIQMVSVDHIRDVRVLVEPQRVALVSVSQITESQFDLSSTKHEIILHYGVDVSACRSMSRHIGGHVET